MTQVWGHRGARREAPENTVSSFRRALELGVDGVEFDVQLTADGELVVIHDETVERTTSGNGHVNSFSLAQLQRLDASAGIEGFAGVPIPTLAEVLDVVAPSGVLLNIELKNSVEEYPGLEEKVLAAVAAYGIADRVVLSSFNHYSLKHLLDLGTTCEVAMLYTDPLYRPWRYAEDLGVAAIHPPARYVVRERTVKKVHKHGMAIRPWVVNSEYRLSQMFRWGVDAVFTDVPDVALRLRDAGSLA
ncbi:MAG: glycerophosphodiester phosphodiesterase [Propionicimonas sp.]|uniref:glycerophosphodiester phosphodiesterase n=1 Tax=Propionicimonas sp. TaxID=1955623 RepID=UPI003D0D8D4B